VNVDTTDVAVIVPDGPPTLTPRGWAILRDALVAAADRRNPGWRDRIVGSDDGG
jgi:hypothetical protein